MFVVNAPKDKFFFGVCQLLVLRGHRRLPGQIRAAASQGLPFRLHLAPTMGSFEAEEQQSQLELPLFFNYWMFLDQGFPSQS